MAEFNPKDSGTAFPDVKATGKPYRPMTEHGNPAEVTVANYLNQAAAELTLARANRLAILGDEGLIQKFARQIKAKALLSPADFETIGLAEQIIQAAQRASQF